MLGEMNAGKTSLMYRFETRRFNAYTTPSVSCDLKVAKVTMVDGKAVGMHLWDIPGR